MRTGTGMKPSGTSNITVAAVFLISVSAILFEIMLARFFSISQWNHLAFMIISMALFGFAAGGTLLSVRGTSDTPAHPETAAKQVCRDLLLYASSTLACFLMLNRMPLDYMELPANYLQIVFILTACLLIAVPFFYAGTVISRAYMTMPEKTGRIYFFNMAGSGLGAFAAFFLLPLMDEGRLIALAAILPLPLLLPIAKTQKSRHFNIWISALGSLLAAGGLFLMAANPHLLHISPSPYKSLSQLLLFPDTTITHEQTGLRGRVEIVDSPYIRFAPGLSLKFNSALPQQRAAFVDGDNRLVFPASFSERSFHYQRNTLAYAGYLVPAKLGNVLVIQNSGGAAVACAFSAGPEKLQVLEKNPTLSDLLAAAYPIRVSSENPRSFLNNCPDLFDVIHIESWGASLPGAAALTQDYSYTTDAFRLYLSRLNRNGVVVVSRRLLLPPSNMLRMCAAACEALLSHGAVPLENHLAIVRNWDTFVMLVSRDPLQNMEAVSAYAENRNFDLVWPQTIDSPLLNRFNAFEEPFHFLGIRELLAAYNAGRQHRFFNQYPLDVTPQSDDRPFPDKFFKWRKGPAIHKMTGSRLYSLLLSGEIVVPAVLGAALLTALFLLFLPCFAVRTRPATIALVPSLYFLAVGAGFILAELFFIHYYTLAFGDPVLSFAAVLASLLVFSGAGGRVSLHLNPRGIRPVILILTALLCMLGIAAEHALPVMVALSAPWRQALAIGLLLPAGLLLGMPFPLGMRHLLKRPRHRAYAWSINGCASVVASVAAVQLGLSAGLKTILWAAAAAYAIAWLTVRPAPTR